MSALQIRSAQSLAVMLLASALFSATPSIIRAQSTKFSVDSYIPERFVDTEMRIHGGFGFYGSDHEREIVSSPFSRYIIDVSDYSSDNQNANFGSFIRQRYETIPKYLDFKLDVRAGYNRYERESYSEERDTAGYYERSDREDRDEHYRIDFNHSVDAGAYFLDDFFLSTFAEVDWAYSDYPTDKHHRKSHYISPQFGGYRRNRQEESILNETGYTKALRTSVSFLSGWGRVYEGEFASTALYLVDELRGNNLLDHEPTVVQMRGLSAIIHRYRLKHAVDSRLHKIEAKDAIVEYLTSEGLMVGPSPLGTLLIEDVWSYFPRFSRKFGFRIRGGFGLEYTHRREHKRYTQRTFYLHTRYHEDTLGVIDTLYHRADTSRDNSYSNNMVTSSPYVIVSVDYHRPFTHRWQLDFHARMRYYLDAIHEKTSHTIHNAIERASHESHEVDFKNYYVTDCSGTLRYIFNSRTELSLLSTLGYNHVDRKVTHLTSANSPTPIKTYKGSAYDDWNYSLGIEATYRIAIPTTLTIGTSYHSGIDLHSTSAPLRFWYYYPASSRVTYLYGFHVPDVAPLTDYDNIYDVEGYSVSATITHYIF